MNFFGVYSYYNLNIALNKTIVTASFNIPYPNTIENNLGYFLLDIAYSEAMVSILQKQAASSSTSHIDNSLILLISLASLIRSNYNK